MRTAVVAAVSVEPDPRPGLSLGGQAAVLRPSHHEQLLSWVHWCHSVQCVLPPGLRQHRVLSDLGMFPSSSTQPLSLPLTPVREV